MMATMHTEATAHDWAHTLAAHRNAGHDIPEGIEP